MLSIEAGIQTSTVSLNILFQPLASTLAHLPQALRLNSS